jgi:predicted HNH restriction endonuclease
VRYPWTDNLLELHHLLPLSSSLTISLRGTSIDDVEPLCPNCHKGIHVYYSTFLRGSGLEDFETKQQAKEVYSEAKRTVVL